MFRVSWCAFCSMSLLFDYMCVRLLLISWSIAGVPSSARRFRASLLLHTTCVRSWCTWRASCVAAKHKNKNRKHKNLTEYFVVLASCILQWRSTSKVVQGAAPLPTSCPCSLACLLCANEVGFCQSWALRFLVVRETWLWDLLTRGNMPAHKPCELLCPLARVPTSGSSSHLRRQRSGTVSWGLLVRD